MSIHTKQRCTQGLWDTTVPGIMFNEKGESNYFGMFRKYMEDYPRGEKGKHIWDKYVAEIKLTGKNKHYDCIIGVSGGTDSSYLMYLAKVVYGLKPLAVTLDNGWSSDISVKNIKKMTKSLNIDLETYVIDYEEIKDILSSYIKATIPWVDYPTDHAIKSILFSIAKREKIKHILIGHDFRSEGTQPNEWTYGDSRQLKYILRTFGKTKIRSFPDMDILEHLYLSYVKKIKMIYPYFFIDYNKNDAREFLIKNFNWEYYGGHHHENMFTKWAIAYWMPEKFGMDKRIITLSAQVVSGELTREEAIETLGQLAYNKDEINCETDYVLKKLGMTQEQFKEYWDRPNKSSFDYPTYHPLLARIAKFIKPIIKLILPQMPSYFLQLEMRASDKQKL